MSQFREVRYKDTEDPKTQSIYSSLFFPLICNFIPLLFLCELCPSALPLICFNIYFSFNFLFSFIIGSLTTPPTPYTHTLLFPLISWKYAEFSRNIAGCPTNNPLVWRLVAVFTIASNRCLIIL